MSFLSANFKMLSHVDAMFGSLFSCLVENLLKSSPVQIYNWHTNTVQQTSHQSSKQAEISVHILIISCLPMANKAVHCSLSQKLFDSLQLNWTWHGRSRCNKVEDSISSCYARYSTVVHVCTEARHIPLHPLLLWYARLLLCGDYFWHSVQQAYAAPCVVVLNILVLYNVSYVSMLWLCTLVYSHVN